MNERELFQNVLILLTKAEYRATGQELMQIAAIIHQFAQWTEARTALEAPKDE